jgi:D-citramalate synthase
MPERFGRERKYALRKTSGKANIEKNCKSGIKLADADLKLITQRIIELGDRKVVLTREDLPYIISDVLDSNTIEEKVVVVNYVLTHSKNLKPSATVQVQLVREFMRKVLKEMVNTMHS